MLSLDPAMRGWMNDVPSYVPPVGIGEVMRAIGVGQVAASRSDRVSEGDYVTGLFGIQEYATLPADALTPVDESMAPLATYLNVLGMPGMTAYFGLLDIGQPKEGETVVVSGAAGGGGGARGRGGRGGRDRRADREDQGLPRRRDRRRTREVPHADRRVRLRRRDRLQVGRAPPSAAREVPRPRERVLRQRRRRGARRGACAARARRADRDLRRGVAVQREHDARPLELHGAARAACPHGGLRGVRLRVALRRSSARDGGLDARGEARRA